MGHGDDRKRPLVVVVTMKAQLRGRIRRNVQTLLDLGADVRVLTIDGRKDFFAGLEHPRLSVQYVEVSSVLIWLNERIRAASGLWLAARMALLGGEETTEYVDVHFARRRWRWSRSNRRTGRGSGRELRLPQVADRLMRWRDRIAFALSDLPSSRYFLEHQDSLLRIAHSGELMARRAARLTWLRSRLLPLHRATLWNSYWRRSHPALVGLAPDLVVSSDLPGLVGASRGARELGVPHLHDCHELYLESSNLHAIERRLLWRIERHYMRRADAVVVVNDSIGQEYRRRYGVSPVVVRNCAQPQETDEIVDIRDLAGLRRDAQVVLYQGGFAPGRGLEVIVRSAGSLPGDAWLVLLGDGSYRWELEELAEESGGGKVRFLDAVPPRELLALTASATVGVVPYQPVSRNNELALPNKVFEYTVAGVPVVLADIPELRTIALGHGCGQVYDPFDARDFVRAVSRVLADGALERYRHAARAYGQANSWDSERKILINEYVRIAPWAGLSDQSQGGSPVRLPGQA